MSRRLPSPEDYEFMNRAKCRGVYGLHTSDERVDINRAKAMCSECPVRDECLDFAIKFRERGSVWGGLTDHERERYRRELAVPERLRRAAKAPSSARRRRMKTQAG